MVNHSAYTVARVREALAEDERTHLLDVEVRISEGQLFLVGPVDSRERREAAGIVASETVPPGISIVNELWIADYQKPSETETMR